MSSDFEAINNLIRRRRSVFPKQYTQGLEIDRSLLEQMLENANWAPTHKLTEPWRFRVFHSENSRQQLSDYLAAYYQENTPADLFSPEKMQKSAENPLRSSAVIAIIMHRNEASGLPEFEEIAAVAMAVQNMWLTCTAAGWGCYWSSPASILKNPDLLQLEPEERCLGLLYIGKNEGEIPDSKRKPIQEKTIWF